MRTLAQSIAKPGKGALAYGIVRGAEEGASATSSPALVACTIFIGSVATAGVALAAATVASTALAGVTAAMAIAIVPSVAVFGGLYATGQIPESTFNEVTALLDGVGSPEGLITTAALLSSRKSLSESLRMAKSVSALRSAAEGMTSFSTAESFLDGYEAAAGIASAFDIVVDGPTAPAPASPAPPNGKSSARSGYIGRGDGDRGMTGAERAMERNAAKASAAERPDTSRTKPETTRPEVRSESKPGRGEVPARRDTGKSSGPSREQSKGTGSRDRNPGMIFGPRS